LVASTIITISARRCSQQLPLRIQVYHLFAENENKRNLSSNNHVVYVARRDENKNYGTRLRECGQFVVRHQSVSGKKCDCQGIRKLGYRETQSAITTGNQRIRWHRVKRNSQNVFANNANSGGRYCARIAFNARLILIKSRFETLTPGPLRTRNKCVLRSSDVSKVIHLCVCTSSRVRRFIRNHTRKSRVR
jgi:hypothetical protein